MLCDPHPALQSKNMIYMAIDPGGSTGVAYSINGKYITNTLTDPRELYELIYENKPDVVAIEAFATDHMISRDGIRTIEIVGGVKALCSVLGIAIHVHTPQFRKAFMQPSQQHMSGVIGKTVHEIDALAHLLRLEHELARATK